MLMAQQQTVTTTTAPKIFLQETDRLIMESSHPTGVLNAIAASGSGGFITVCRDRRHGSPEMPRRLSTNLGT
jgi:hypothetical protein